MRSSTFSSDRVGDGPQATYVVAGIVAGLLILLAVESLWRVNGAVSNFVDNKPRWSWFRSQVADNSGVTLLGASRMHFGFSLAAFRDRYPDTPVHQLAVAGQTPYAALRDLAETESFKGVVLISFTPDIVMAFRHEDQQQYVDHYRDRLTIDVQLNFLAESFAEQFLISRQYNYGIDSILRKLVGSGELPPAVLYLETQFDREIHADYSMEDVDAHRQRRIAEATGLYDHFYPISPDLWRQELAEFLGYAKTIHDRGGCVIAIRFPSGSELYEREQALFPKQDFWAALETVPYLGSAHFEDLAIMDSIVLPDLQHVEKPDKYRFTDALLTQLESAAAGVDGGHCALGN